MEQNLPNQDINTEQKKENIHLPKKLEFLKRRTVLFGVITIGVIFLIAITLLVSNQTQKPETSKQTPEEFAKTQIDNLPGTLLFEPATVNANPGQKNSVDILMNTGGHEIYGVILAIKYIPEVIGNVELVQYKDPTSAISSTFQLQGKPLVEDGAILVTLKLPAGTPPLKGIGKIATLSFVPKKVNVAIPSTSISILPVSSFIRTENSPEFNVNSNRLMVLYPQK